MKLRYFIIALIAMGPLALIFDAIGIELDSTIGKVFSGAISILLLTISIMIIVKIINAIKRVFTDVHTIAENSKREP